MCTAEGFCAFPDEMCPGGQRYGQYAGSLSGECVPVDDGSTGDDPDATGPGPTSTSAGTQASVSSSTPDPSTTDMIATTAASSSSGDEMCPAGQTSCPSGCVDTNTNVANCGACGRACDGAAACIDGDCVTSKLIFVTSGLFTGDMGGLEGADAGCQQAADDAGLEGVFMAWLSDDGGNPVTRMTGHDGPYVRVDGVMVAENWDELRDGELLDTISVTELGTEPLDAFVCSGQEVWTNTTAFGSIVSSIDDCLNWSSPMAYGRVGRWSMFDERWTNDGTCLAVGCNGGLPMYCVQQ